MKIHVPRRRTASVAGAVVLALLAATSSATPSVAAAYPNPGVVAGRTWIADPTMLIKPTGAGGPRYLVMGTNNQTLASQDRVTFTHAGLFFPDTPDWWDAYSGDSMVAGNADVWAPDVSFRNGKYWLYYAVSRPGSRNSAIGVATSDTALPGTWTDHGRVFSSTTSNTYNAIDPNLVVDPDGSWWLVFGSFWDGIFLLPLNPTTGKPSAGATMTNLARQPVNASGGRPIENGFIYQRGGYYYLFVSVGYCCRGVNSTYSIQVGRSASITGPYVDENGVAMLDGGGTPVLETHGYVIGPGGQGVYFDDYWGPHDLLVYHYYDARVNGINSLGINFLGWKANGFPYAY